MCARVISGLLATCRKSLTTLLGEMVLSKAYYCQMTCSKILNGFMICPLSEPYLQLQMCIVCRHIHFSLQTCCCKLSAIGADSPRYLCVHNLGRVLFILPELKRERIYRYTKGFNLAFVMFDLRCGSLMLRPDRFDSLSTDCPKRATPTFS